MTSEEKQEKEMSVPPKMIKVSPTTHERLREGLLQKISPKEPEKKDKD
jgi:hypothetical protein